MAARAIAGDPRMLHGRAWTECREHRGGMTVLARQTKYRDVIGGLLLRHNVGETQAGPMALRAVGGDSGVIHRVNGVVAGVRVTQRARLGGRDVIGRLAGGHHRECRRGAVALRTVAGGGVIGILRGRRAINDRDAVPRVAGLMATRTVARYAGMVHRRSRPEGREIRGPMTGLAGGGSRDVLGRRLLRYYVREAQSRAVALSAVSRDSRVIHLVDGIVARIAVAQRARLSGRDVIGWLATRGVDGERGRGCVARRAIAGGRMIGILCFGGPNDYRHAVPGFAGLMAARAIAGDARMVHDRARSERREHRGRVTVRARQTADRQVRCRRFLGCNVCECQARSVALLAVGGDPLMVHHVERVVARGGVAERANLGRGYVIGGFIAAGDAVGE